MNISVGDASGIVQAGVGVATVLGGAIGVIWREIRKGRRADALRFKSIEDKLEECRQREGKQAKRSAVHVTVIELLWQEVTRLFTRAEPGSRHADNPTLKRAKKLLDGLKSGLPEDEPSLSDLAEEIDRRMRRRD